MILEIIGWLGTAAFVTAYLLVSCGKLKADEAVYQWMNLGGAVAVGLSVFPLRAWPAFFLELIWGSIALSTLIRGYRRRLLKKGTA